MSRRLLFDPGRTTQNLHRDRPTGESRPIRADIDPFLKSSKQTADSPLELVIAIPGGDLNLQSTHTTIERLMAAVDEHDPYTGAHSCRVASLAVLLSRFMGMDDDAVDIVGQAGLVHDVGKMAMPPDILTKEGRLDDLEFKMIQLHATLGASILAAVGGLDHLVPIVLHHHERWDGRGYPTGLSGIHIPIESRIILVADAYDAMTTDRPYGEVMSSNQAMEEIERCANEQFDPLVAQAMRLAYDGGLIEEYSSPDSRRFKPSDRTVVTNGGVLGEVQASDARTRV